MYRIIVKDISGNTLGEIDRFEKLKFRHVLNREGDCSFAVSIMDEKLQFLNYIGLREIYVYRNDDIVWGGLLLNNTGSIRWQDDLEILNALGFFVYAKSWNIEGVLTYANTDRGQIAWNLINYGQGKTYGNRGITQGTIQSSFTATSKKFEEKKVYDAIIDLTELKTGFDFEVTQTKVFNVYKSKGSDKTASAVFINSKNIERLDYASDFSSPINKARVMGGGYGDAMAIANRSDAVLQQSYGLWEDFVPYKDVEETADLQARGDEEIFRRGLPRKTYTLSQKPGSEPDWTSLSVGDSIRLDVERGYKSFHDAVRINSIQVEYVNGVEYPSYSFVYG